LEGFIIGMIFWAGPALLAWIWRLFHRPQAH
jgi:hypothetical protein